MESTQLAPIPAAAGQAQTTVDEVDLTPVRTYWQLVRQRFMTRDRIGRPAGVATSFDCEIPHYPSSPQIDARGGAA